MKEFITAVEDIEAEDERAARIKARTEALISDGVSPEEAKAKAEAEVEPESYVEFKVDGRTLRAYQPTDGQMVFMLAAMGRGQTQDQRFAAIVNIMLSALRDEDADYLESRLLSRDSKKRLPLAQVEAIFEHLVEEWFGRPTQ